MIAHLSEAARILARSWLPPGLTHHLEDVWCLFDGDSTSRGRYAYTAGPAVTSEFTPEQMIAAVSAIRTDKFQEPVEDMPSWLRSDPKTDSGLVVSVVVFPTGNMDLTQSGVWEAANTPVAIGFARFALDSDWLVGRTLSAND